MTMRDGPPTELLKGSYAQRLRVSSWRDGQLLADDVPVTNADLYSNRDTPVPHQLRLSVPAADGWVPTDPWHPLAAFGQRLSVDVLTTDPSGADYVTPLGQFLVQGYSRRNTVIDVEALDLTQLLWDYRLLRPRQPPGTATFTSELLALVRDTLPVRVDGLTDRALPTGLATEWTEDRWGALTDLATAWPAQLDTDESGQLVAHPVPTVGTPVREWTHGTAGAYVELGHESLRDEVYNGVVARGTTADGADVSAVAVDDVPTSPTYWNGPYGRRPRFYFSPVLDSVFDCARAARTVLARELRRTRQVELTAPPDPRLQLDDTVAVTDELGRTVVGQLLQIRLPLTALQGPATYTVTVGGAS